jgi:catechol-2,3-dioxygenase
MTDTVPFALGPFPATPYGSAVNAHKGRRFRAVERWERNYDGPMPVQRLNHAVLYVRDVERSVAFYTEALGFRVRTEIPGRAAFLQAEDSTNDHDLGLFAVDGQAGDSTAGRSTVGLYHLAWEVDTLAELRRIAGVLTERGALVGASDHGTTKALYARDPDSIEFEVSWLLPADLLPDEITPRTAPLDIDAEIERYGAETRGGLGVSAPSH